jgi:superfamily II DNA or RNA helicase
MIPVLRPYQEQGIENLRKQIRWGRLRVILVCPTGGGKTVLAAWIIDSALKNGCKVLFIVHRLELIDQTVRQLAKYNVLDVGVMRADDKRTNPDAPVQVATYQTLNRRELPSADIIISDECHYDAGETRRRLLESYPNAQIIGLTATPCRYDGEPLSPPYDALEVAATYSELIDDKFIVAPKVFSNPAPVDLSSVRTQHGDYVLSELEFAMNQAKINGDLVKEWLKRSEGRRTVAFAVTVKHSLSIVESFLAAGVRAEHIDGETPLEARRACLRRLEDRFVSVVSNVDVLGEGFDSPPVKCIVMARPTKSLRLYIQQSGRALRPWEGVTPLILDHAGNVDRHGSLPHEDREWSLIGMPRLKREVSPYRTCPACYAYVLNNPCELCGFLQPVQERLIKENRGVNLVERNTEDVRRVFFVAKLEQARQKGYKPGFAAMKYQEKFNERVPFSWGNEAKRSFAEDPAWQSRQEEHARERDWWQGNQGISVEVPEEEKREKETREKEEPTESESLDFGEEELPF